MQKCKLTKMLASLLFLTAWCDGVAAEADRPLILTDSYVGREADAPWRQAAAERIEKYRKGDITVVVADERGRALPGADVSVRMTRHAFWFGSRADVRLITSDEADARKYREHFTTLFNYATVNTVYYFQWSTPERARETLRATLQAIPWLRKHRYPMRGHTLVWWFRDEMIRKSPQEVYERVVQHIYQTAGNPLLAEAFAEWDVQNEPYGNSEIFTKLGREKLPDFFRLVHKLDPDARLFLNEASLISQMHKEDWRKRLDFIYDLVKGLQDKDVPIHGLGFQSHHIQTLAPIPAVIETLDRFARLGLDMQITEYDIKLRPVPGARDWQRRWRGPVATTPELEKLEGQYLSDFLTAVFSQPRVTAFIMWGFWDGRHWLHNGPIFRKDWSLKPSGQAYKDLVLDKWWTNEQGQTDDMGTFRSRCFLGEHEVAVEFDGHRKTVQTTIPRDGRTIKVTLSSNQQQ